MKQKVSIPIVVSFILLSTSCARQNYNSNSGNTNIQKVRTYWEEVWNKGNLQAVAEFYHPNAKQGENFSIEGFQKGVKFQREVFPDFRVEIKDIFATGDKVITEVTYIATHTGKKMFGQQPLGKEVSVPGLDIFTFKDGKVIEHQHVADHLDLVLQMGIKLAPVKDPEVVKKEIVQASEEYIQLIKLLHAGSATADSEKTKYLKEVSEKLATDYENTDGVGKTFTKNDDLEYYNSPGIKLTLAEVTDRKVKVNDTNTAIETGILSFLGTKNEKPFSYKKKYTTTWIWRESRWQIIADHAVNII